MPSGNYCMIILMGSLMLSAQEHSKKTVNWQRNAFPYEEIQRLTRVETLFNNAIDKSSSVQNGLQIFKIIVANKAHKLTGSEIDEFMAEKTVRLNEKFGIYKS